MEDSFAVSFFVEETEHWRKLFNRTGIKKERRGILS